MAEVDATVWLLLALFLAIAAIDWAAVHARSKAVEYVAKPGAMVPLVAAAAVLDPADDAARTALVVALVLSTLGDVFLVLPARHAEGSRLFLAGLASFLCAHLAYVAGFALDGLEAGGLLLGVALAAVLVVAVGRPVLAAVRAGDEAAMATPVAAYVGVIAAMVLAAAGTGDPRAVAGAVLFATSDALIARDRFVRPAAWAPLVIIVTYHLAQLLLVTSFAQGSG